MPELRSARRLLACLLLLCSGLAAAAPRIGLLTMDPGEEYWARFGHNAIVVVDDGRATSYNYGYFDFEQPGFLLRFLRGHMLYRLVALPADVDLDQYRRDGRGVRIQWLAIEGGAARRLADALAENARPENADYRYDYFLANCSTRVRDRLDEALGGELKRQSQSRSHGFTWRSEALRLSGPLAWMALGIDFGLGPATDAPLSRWEEAFVPDRLAATLREVRLADGRPLVIDELQLVAPALPPAPEQPPDWWLQFALAGLALCALLAWTLDARSAALRRAGAGLLGGFWLLCGLGGLGLLALWLGTEHWAAWRNANALLANPLCLLLLGAVPALLHGETVSRRHARIAAVVLAGAGLAVFLSWVQARGQEHLSWMLLLLPSHAWLAWRLSRGREEDADQR